MFPRSRFVLPTRGSSFSGIRFARDMPRQFPKAPRPRSAHGNAQCFLLLATAEACSPQLLLDPSSTLSLRSVAFPAKIQPQLHKVYPAVENHITLSVFAAHALGFLAQLLQLPFRVFLNPLAECLGSGCIRRKRPQRLLSMFPRPVCLPVLQTSVGNA